MKLLDYIRGNRKGKEAHRLEKESMKDSFLSDALDGYWQVDGNHEEQIDRLRIQISKRSVKNRNMYAAVWSIASCLIIGIGVSFYFLFLKENTTEDVFIAKEQSQLTIFAPALPEEKSTASENKKERENSALVATVPQAGDRGERMAKSKSVMKEYSALAAKQKEVNLVIEAELDSDSQTNKVVRLSAIPENELVDKKIAVTQAEPIQAELMMIRGTSRTRSDKTDYKAFIEKLPKDKVAKMTPKPTIGMRKYKKYLNKNLVHPTDDVCKEVKGEVTVMFFVDPKGVPNSFIITKGLCESADKEAIRLIKEGPEWTVRPLPVEVTVKF